MRKILVATEKPFAPVAIKGIREVTDAAGYELILLEKYTSKQQLLDAISNVDAVIIRSDIVDAEVMSAAKNLKIVVRAGAGYDNVDLAAATEKNICVMNTPGQNSNAVAELVFGMLVFMARGMFNGAAGCELKGRTIGIHAFGNVGRNVARIAKGFGMNVAVYDAFVSKEAVEDAGCIWCETPEKLYSVSDVVSLHLPATAETKQSIGKALLMQMPKPAFLVNTARKEVINEPELLEVMAERPDFKYVTDIAPVATDEFAKFEGRYFATPKKMGAQTAEANINAGIAAAKQIVAFFEEGCERFRLNK